MALSRIEIEFGESECRKCRDEECRVREIGRHRAPSAGTARDIAEKSEGHGSRRHAERDHIGQRIEFFADRTGYAEESCGESVEEIEDGAENDEE